VLLAILLGTSSSGAFTIVPGHPRLYFTAGDLDTLRARIATTHAAEWQALLAWPQPDAGAFTTYSGRDATRTHRYIERNAFIYLMLAESDPPRAAQAAQVARNWLVELATHEFATSPNDAFEYLWALAIGYDWLHGWAGFTEADRQLVRDQLVDHGGEHVNRTGLDGFPDFPTGAPTSKSIYENMSTENNMANAFVGLALWESDDAHGSNTFARRLLDAAYYRFREMYAATRAHAPDGGWWEGQGYAGARLQGEVYFAYVWLAATGEDLFAGNEHLRHAVDHWIYGLRPDGLASREGDQTCVWPAGCDRARFVAFILADYHRDGHFQWFARRQGAFGGTSWEDIVFRDASLEPIDPSSLPLHRQFRIGRVVVRTGWDLGPASDDTYFTFEMHDWVSGHTHLDVGSFTLFRRAPLAIDSGRYRGNNAVSIAHERNYALRSVAHNTLTVYRPGEDFGPFARDGGQEFLFREDTAAEPRFVGDLADGTRFDTATLEAFEAGPGHYYMKGNATDAYHSTGYHAPGDGAEAKLSRFTREIALFPDQPDPLAIVFDRVATLSALWPVRWLLHALEEPSVSGAVTSTEIAGHITTHAGDLVTITAGSGRLFSRTLLPASARIRKVGGAGHEFWVDDPGANYPLSTPDAEAGAWRVEVHAAAPATDQTFLHVLAVTDTAVTAMPSARLIDAGTAWGVEVADRVAVFRKGTAPIQALAYTVEAAAGTVRHLLTGLAPGSYRVTLEGAVVAGSPFPTSSERTLTFETSGAGALSVTLESGIADLAVTAVEGSPAGANPGAGFSVTDTVHNSGTAAAGVSAVGYYLSIDRWRGAGDLPLEGARSVPGLPAGDVSSGAATLVVPDGVQHGIYFLLACADDAGEVVEGGETDNCLASRTTVQVGAADLVTTAIGEPPAAVRAGAAFPLTDTVENRGTIDAGGTTARYYLSLDGTRDDTDVTLGGSRTVGTLIPGAASSGAVTVTVPTSTAQGIYRVLACADAGGSVVESDEANNCLAAGGSVEVQVPDLVVASASAAPLGVSPGSSLAITETVENRAVVDAGASKTRYYLSADTAAGPGDRLLTGSRSVPALPAGAGSTGTVTVTVPGTTPLGLYHLLACADDLGAVAEQDETNNCQAASDPVEVGRPDLVVAAMLPPPPLAQPGGTMAATETVENRGSVTASASKTRFYLSVDAVKSNDDRLLGARDVTALDPGGVNTGTASVTVPSTTPAGTYRLLACADDLKKVSESSETNNCLAAPGEVTLGGADLVVSAVSNPPATTSRGKKVSITDTTRNQGVAAAGRSSRTRYYLSVDTASGTGDRLLTGTRLVADLAAGAASTGTVTVTVPANTAPGLYYLLACADGTAVVAETVETNNCRASASRVTVNP
jgi:heparin/heparan-sulfate lyase